MRKLFFTIIVICLCVLTMTFSSVGAGITYPIHFYWDASTGQVDGYRIYWGDVPGGEYPNQLCEVNGTTLDYVASLNKDQEYYLICRAFNVYGEGGNSNEVYCFYSAPGIPGNLYWSVDLSKLMKDLGAKKIQFISK